MNKRVITAPVVTSVSYTHLDVYKRQRFLVNSKSGEVDIPEPHMANENKCIVDTASGDVQIKYVDRSVSYTHLDVYKRQIEYSSFFFIIFTIFAMSQISFPVHLHLHALYSLI